MNNMNNMIKMIDISKIGERGQIVIPLEMRQKLGIKPGEKFLVVNRDRDIIFRAISENKSIERIEEDLIDMKIADKRWKEIEQGKLKKSTKKEFLKELENW